MRVPAFGKKSDSGSQSVPGSQGLGCQSRGEPENPPVPTAGLNCSERAHGITKQATSED